METNIIIGGMRMESYKKPTIVSQETIRGVIPLAALSASGAAALASVVGIGLGLLATNNSRGTHEIILFRRGLALQTCIE